MLSTIARRAYGSHASAPAVSSGPILVSTATLDLIAQVNSGLPAQPPKSLAPTPTPEIAALRVKEKGSWKDLTIAERQALYDASFRTFHDNRKAKPRGAIYLGVGAGVGAGLLLFVLGRLVLARDAETPRTLTKEWKEARRQIAIRTASNPVYGESRATWQDTVFNMLKKPTN
ncbi:cytochrome c oxidase subunit IV [Capsaspora owczarzaki ATCC 30864]|uniref:Cytochrome c oxidase subunit IV n=1 Tax=Capsaspora owczarzaki (strain ATCC 30864) TaxID=595528 RepID=A0A0D2X539_CAPO3|nr:cytochrome c oxidase subunit IV [Capsaspora owczarzaki ATCC 30864]KJE97139.1 cytochrome c oxidase subunit IV [Capsaspora owczarzaki ATCC 30864]|eukprot:XP_004343473.1 cytochrome c oxidase subunit IV [Capsaspora owczarzaki ATCC 30864]